MKPTMTASLVILALNAVYTMDSTPALACDRSDVQEVERMDEVQSQPVGAGSHSTGHSL